jgi:hypothetical protein
VLEIDEFAVALLRDLDANGSRLGSCTPSTVWLKLS